MKMGSNKTDIKNTLRKLVDYFRMQEDASSQEERADLWSKIEASIEQKKQKRKLHYWLMTAASAAALFGLVWMGTEWYVQNDRSNISIVAARMMNKSTATVSDDVQLLSQGTTISVKKGATVTYSQEGDISVDEERVSDVVTADDLYDQIVVPKGKFTRLVLSDGSSLHINAGTRVIYPKRFEKNRREIFVDGEIFIDVKRNESAPFFVKTANFEVEVLGTAFNVNAYSEDAKAEVTLIRGSVNIKDKLKHEIRLSPNQLGAITSGSITGKHTVNASDYIAWTKGLLVLNTESLGNVLRKLQRYYGVKITFDPSITELNMEGILDLSCSLSEVLRRLSVTAPISFHETESGFTINRKSDK